MPSGPNGAAVMRAAEVEWRPVLAKFSSHHRICHWYRRNMSGAGRITVIECRQQSKEKDLKQCPSCLQTFPDFIAFEDHLAKSHILLNRAGNYFLFKTENSENSNWMEMDLGVECQVV